MVHCTPMSAVIAKSPSRTSKIFSTYSEKGSTSSPKPESFVPPKALKWLILNLQIWKIPTGEYGEVSVCAVNKS